MRTERLRHEFVDRFPAQLEQGVIFISIPFATTAHLCCCGCGSKTVNPLTPTDWSITYDGETISLSPSVGNWSYECESHYWIEGSCVIWAPKWTKERIALGRAKDRVLKDRHHSEKSDERIGASSETEETIAKVSTSGVGRFLRRLIGRRR